MGNQVAHGEWFSFAAFASGLLSHLISYIALGVLVALVAPRLLPLLEHGDHARVGLTLLSQTCFGSDGGGFLGGHRLGHAGGLGVHNDGHLHQADPHDGRRTRGHREAHGRHVLGRRSTHKRRHRHTWSEAMWEGHAHGQGVHRHPLTGSLHGWNRRGSGHHGWLLHERRLLRLLLWWLLLILLLITLIHINYNI